MALDGEDIVVVRPVRDAYGDVVSYSEHTLPDCLVSASSGSSGTATSHESLSEVISIYQVFVLADADVVASDRLRRPSDPTPDESAGFKVRAPWMVRGDPAVWKSPFSGWNPGMVLRIERVTG